MIIGNPIASLYLLALRESIEEIKEENKQCKHPMYDHSRSILIEKNNKKGQIRVCPECSMLILEGEINL